MRHLSIILGLLVIALTGCDDVSTRTPDVIEVEQSDDSAVESCQIDCDCAQGEACVSGVCTALVDKIYCCDKAGCPQGEACVTLEGRQSTCSACVVACDCPQGQDCFQGSCMAANPPVYCCENSGCPANQPCVDASGAAGTCARQCTVNCDCPQGQLCTASGLCVQGVEPAYCCEKEGCPLGEACTSIEGESSTCRECEHSCDCPQGEACSASGICVAGLEPTFCCEKAGCPEGEACIHEDDRADVCKPVCGNGVIETGETCDGNCPSSCKSNDPCIEGVLKGSASNCTAVCSWEPVNSCSSGDGCCPEACTHDSDNDCSRLCGNGELDPGESCDGNCPTSCADAGACTKVELVGTADQCTARCTSTPIVSCINSDGCCPSGCTFSNDDDCEQVTGAIGSPCRIDADCNNGGFCIVTWTASGYCSKACTRDADCGSGSHCGFIDSEGNGSCVKSCDDSSDCRTPEYGCYNRDQDVNNFPECAPLGTGQGAVGAACERVSDCQGGEGAGCYNGRDWKNGYCVRSCTSSCPAGSHCSDGQCLKGCVN
ncbi:MAG: hypothetical protein RBU37_25350, partial [Myxococcota bacterium]|nr:hypothetical protein [Myxococcota bacterium]